MAPSPIARMLAICSCACGLFAARVLAGPPMITDDPGTTPEGQASLKLAYELAHARDTWVHVAPLAEFQWGITGTLELTVDESYVIADEPHDGPRGVAGNTDLSLKWRFLEQPESGEGVDVSVAPQVSLLSPSAFARRDVLDRGTDVLLPLQVGHDFGGVTLFADAGYQFTQFGGNLWSSGVAADWEVEKDKFHLLCEFHEFVDDGFRHPSPIVQVGTTWTFTENWTLLGSVGRSLRSGDADPRLLCYLAIEYDF